MSTRDGDLLIDPDRGLEGVMAIKDILMEGNKDRGIRAVKKRGTLYIMGLHGTHEHKSGIYKPEHGADREEFPEFKRALNNTKKVGDKWDREVEKRHQGKAEEKKIITTEHRSESSGIRHAATHCTAVILGQEPN
ncbi:hypothetical protein GWI33_022646 [Rhynchophorus ferrugineus]|uniref:Uncharacterized protein n=1 Tax=Rhynchophorus ferrugineus TaxID=354439 RepID=A0A834MIX5_RHYFE|nr:hypothetical protein GWI33_022646 [Rhynchophorus ferrugineus]